MAWPPVIPPTGRTNDTPTKDAHPSDHNVTAQALTDLVTKVQANTDAITAAATVVPWITLPMTAPWAAYGSGYQPPQYRKVGDVVQLRGVANKGSNYTSMEVFATLPAGYTPPAKIQVLAIVGAAWPVNLEIGADGKVYVAGWQQVGTYIVFDGTKGFSVTP